MLFAGVAFSAAALYELHDLDSTIDEGKNRQNLLVRQVDSLTDDMAITVKNVRNCLLYTSPSPRDKRQSRMPSSA